MKRILCVVLCLCGAGLLLPSLAVAEPWIIEEGQANASIVTAEDPPRRVKLAATELQTYLERITGARLPVGAEPSEQHPVTIYVGRSRHTDELGIDEADLDHGAFRMVSRADSLVLLGRDEDFEPREPWARSHGDRERAQAAWEEISGGHWLNPMNSVFRRWHQRGGEDSLGWAHDKGGSLNAVYEFLRTLGVRWYMPGELGEVTPQRASIALPDIDRTVTPDFAVRFWHGAHFVYEAEDVMWERRLGMNSAYEVLGAGMHVHGMRLIHGHEKLQQAHPEYYALIEGERDTHHRGTGHACFSSEGLEREAVRFARATFDHLDEPAVSLWPQDGYRGCECELCEGQSASELVWGFIDRVARELHETHPDRLVTGGAYAQYRMPPDSIDTFSPNVAVFISNVGRPTLDDPEQWDAYWEFIQSWREKLGPKRIIRNENNRYSASGGASGAHPVPFPVLHPRAMARDLRELEGISLGDWNEQARANFGQPGKSYWRAPGLDHLTLYVNARFLWDAGQDLDALLDEYYELFYGPAAEEMRAAFDFAQATYQRDERPTPGRIDLEDRLQLVEMLHTARDAAGDTIHGQRIELILSELPPRDELRRDAAIAEQRADVPVFTRAIDMGASKWDEQRDTFVLDGRIDEPFWQVYPHGGGLRQARSGERAEHSTTFYVRWLDGHIYFAIRCEDPATESLNISTTEDGDLAILDGDHVEIMLETDVHRWYRLVINPAGALLDMDMAAEDEARQRWKANADAAAHIGEDGWSVEARIPVVSEQEGAMDPLHNVVGHKPSSHRSRAVPWRFNVGRVRVRDGEREVSAYSPTESNDVQDPMSFGELYLR